MTARQLRGSRIGPARSQTGGTRAAIRRRARRQMRARQELHGRPSLPLSWSTAFPPVAWWFLPDHRRCSLHREVVAELPQLLRRPGVLEENLIDVEGVKRAGTVAIDGLPNAGDKVSQLRLVVLSDHGARCSSLRLAGHEYEATQPSLAAAPPDGSRGPRQLRMAAERLRAELRGSGSGCRCWSWPPSRGVASVQQTDDNRARVPAVGRAPAERVRPGHRLSGSLHRDLPELARRPLPLNRFAWPHAALWSRRNWRAWPWRRRIGSPV